jgi:CRISPR-associated protein Csm2
MKTIQKLRSATPLEKAQILSLMASPMIRGRAVAGFAIKKTEEAMQDFSLSTYKDAVLGDLRAFKGSGWDWQRRIGPVLEREQGYLINDYILKEMDAYENLAHVPSRGLIAWAEVLAALLVAVGLRTNQIRKFLDSVRKLEVNIKRKAAEEFTTKEVVFLKVHLAYAKARQDSVRPFMLVMNKALDKVRDEGKEGFADFEQLVRFVEAVVAYHKYYGGND